MTDYAGSNHNNTGVVIQINNDGTWANGGPITTANITDGTSNTMALGEKRHEYQCPGHFPER